MKVEEKLIILIPDHDSNLTKIIENNFDGKIIIVSYMLKKNTFDLIEKINSIESNEILIVNYSHYYRDIIPNLKNKKIKWLITHSVASFTDPNINIIFTTSMEFYDRGLINKILTMDKGLFHLLKKNNYNTEIVSFKNDDSKITYQKNGVIGVISNDTDPRHNIYNQLTALKLINYKQVKLDINMNATLEFLKKFHINYNDVESEEDLINCNEINMYCNFTNSNNHSILKSLNAGIPCLVGNSDLFDEIPILKEYLVLESDDDVNEIAFKIDKARKNRDLIIDEFNKSKEKIQC